MENSRRPWSDSLRALRKLELWKGREAERVRRGVVVRNCEEMRVERRVRGLVREDMIFGLVWFFLGGSYENWWGLMVSRTQVCRGVQEESEDASM